VLAPDALRRRYAIAAALFAVATVAALWIDMPVARWVDKGGFRRLGDFDSVVVWSEFFAHGVGVSLILVTVYVLDPERRRCMLRLGLLSLGTGIFANLAKLFVARARPSAADIDGTIFATFHGLFPTSSDWKSLPSGHTATAVGLAIGLAWLYPRGRWLFFAFSAIAASQRWANRDHFVSDSCAGAALACLVAAVLLGSSPLQRQLEKLEVPEHDEPESDIASASELIRPRGSSPAREAA
jgi:membrane-associated phospholipid phosphatase